MSYTRVIPRDLFNESKLLKCLGQLALIIHDRVGVPTGLTLEHDDTENAGFQIEQDDSTGALYCENLTCSLGARIVGLRAPYNHKGTYPLQFECGDDEGAVFNEDGTLSEEFKDMLMPPL